MTNTKTNSKWIVDMCAKYNFLKRHKRKSGHIAKQKYFRLGTKSMFYKKKNWTLSKLLPCERPCEVDKQLGENICSPYSQQ